MQGLQRKNEDLGQQPARSIINGSKREHPMKKLLFGLSASMVVISFTASGDILNLTDPSRIPVPPGTHVDSYQFPTGLLNSSNPMTKLSLAYSSLAAPGYHEIMSANLLFDSAQVPNLTEVLSTPTDYEASVEFSVPVTEVSPSFAPAFWAVHGEIGGGAVYTDLRWTAWYLDGTERSAYDGIIPEPAAASLLLLGGLILLIGRSCRTSECSGPGDDTPVRGRLPLPPSH
jgi:hypothetical protein